MKQFYKENRYFLIPYFTVLLICFGLLLSYPKAQLHIISNRANNQFFDFFFKYATYLGNGAMVALVSIVLLLKKYCYALTFLTGSLLTVLVVNLFKKVLLHEIYRPSKYFELFETYKLHLVEGIKMHSFQSFPSGHSATAFNIFFMLALLTKNKLLKLIFFTIAALVSYSRVYLSQHFLVDITIGSVMGVLFLALAFLWFQKIDKVWLNNSLLTKK